MLTCKSPRKVMRVAYQAACQCLPRYSNRFSRRDFTLAQLFACLVVREHMGCSYRKAEALLKDCDSLAAATSACESHPKIRRKNNLTGGESSGIISGLSVCLKGDFNAGFGFVGICRVGRESARGCCRHWVGRIKPKTGRAPRAKRSQTKPMEPDGNRVFAAESRICRFGKTKRSQPHLCDPQRVAGWEAITADRFTPRRASVDAG